MVKFGRDLKDHLVQNPCFGHGQVVQSPIQFHVEHFQGWGIHNFSEQPVPVFHNLHHKNVFPMYNLNLFSFSLKLLPLALRLQALVKIFSLLFLIYIERLQSDPHGDFSFPDKKTLTLSARLHRYSSLLIKSMAFLWTWKDYILFSGH